MSFNISRKHDKYHSPDIFSKWGGGGKKVKMLFILKGKHNMAKVSSDLVYFLYLTFGKLRSHKGGLSLITIPPLIALFA